MDELIDILDPCGNYTGKTELKSHAHNMGLFHATVHIWFYTLDRMVLLQQRGKNKSMHPLLWDVSVAGHVATQETIEMAALREVEEEIGLKISKTDLEKIGVFKSVKKSHGNFIDCEFNHTFLCELKASIERLKKQESEVEALKLVPLVEFSTELKHVECIKKYVPHDAQYYVTIIQNIERRL